MNALSVFLPKYLRGQVVHLLHVGLVLGDGPHGVGDHLRCEVFCAQDGEHMGPVEGLGEAGGLAEIQIAGLAQELDHLYGECIAKLREAGANDFNLPVEFRVADIEKETASAQRIGDHARTVTGQDHQRLLPRLDHPQFGDGNLEIAQALQEQRLEFIAGSIDLVDKEQ